MDKSNIDRTHIITLHIRTKFSELQARQYKVTRTINDLRAFLDYLNQSLSKIDQVKLINTAA